MLKMLRSLQAICIFAALLFVCAFFNPTHAQAIIYRGDIKLPGGDVNNLALRNPVIMINGRYYIPLTNEYLATIGLSVADYNAEKIANGYSAVGEIKISAAESSENMPESEFGENIDIRRISPLAAKISINGNILRSSLPTYWIEGIAYICIDDTNDFEYDSTIMLRRGINPQKAELPARYNSIEALGTENFVKDQGSTQDCWAYAAASLLEIKIALTSGNYYDISETDIIKNCPIPSDSVTGGSWRGSSAYFTDGLGTVYIREYREISGVEHIKEAISQNGAALTSIYYGPLRMQYFEKENSAYYHKNASQKATHELVLIGWDDSYPKEKFSNQPPGDGAFIAMNSFGENFGERGLFYISYYDDIAALRAYTVDSCDTLPNAQNVLAIGESGVTHYETMPGKGNIYGIVQMRLSDFGIDDNSNKRIRGIGVFSSGNAIVSAYYSERFPAEHTSLTFLGDTYFNEAGFKLIDCYYNTALPEEFCIVLKYNSLERFVLPIEAPYPGIDYAIPEQKAASFIAYEDGKKLTAAPLETIKQKASVVLRLIIE